MKPTWVAWALSASAALAGPAGAADLMHFSVTQVRQLKVGTPAVRAYLDLADTAGQRPEALPKTSLTATLGEWRAELVNLTPAWTIQQGVAYVFLVDISKSLNSDLFRSMVAGIETWIRGMEPEDRAAIIVFGEQSREVVDFTGDKERLLSALADLGPTDDLTLLHQALADALDLTRRLDPDLPSRRVIVVFSDGKDEGSSYEAEDVMARLRIDPAPIYAIGYSRLRDPQERRDYLELLQRFAFHSGGTFFAAEQTRFEEAYAAIHDAIGDVWIADFVCAECRLDGSVHRLQVKVELAGQALSNGGSVRLLPLATATAGAPMPPQTSDSGAPRGPEDEPRPGDDLAGSPSRSYRLPYSLAENLPWVVAAFAVLVILLLYWQLRRSKARSTQHSPGATDFDPDFPPGPIDPRSEGTVLDPPVPVPYPGEGGPRARSRRRQRSSEEERPPARRSPAPSARPRQVRLIVVRGSRKGRQYSFIVKDRAVVGARSDCDCVLSDEPGIDAEQFELIHQEGALFLRNLSEQMPTLLTGQPVVDRVRLTSDSLIGTGETVLRLVFH